MFIPSSKVSIRFQRAFLVFVLLFSASSLSAQVTMKEYLPFMFQLDETISPLSKAEQNQEASKVIEIQKDVSEQDLMTINYWNASYPSYRWHQIMMEISRDTEGHKNGGRVVILHLAIYDALVEVRKHKQQFEVNPPFELNTKVQKLGRKREYSSFVCEWSAAAGAAQEVIGYYFPKRKAYLDSLIKEFKRARLMSGLQLPSDIENGINIGRQIAVQYIDYAKTDRTDHSEIIEVPKSEHLWSGDPGKWDPMKRQWKPLTLDSASQFRPGSPPADWSKDMQELRDFNATHKTSDIAWKWKNAPVWDDLLERKTLEYDLNPVEAAFACALHHTARFDGIIAAWDGKYHYWGIRPFQYDPDFEPILVGTPNFPGYPAGHTTVAGSISTVLSYLFPQDKEYFEELAKECSESRFEGGVHFRTDNEVGLTVGSKVGSQVIEVFTQKE